jgi:hypothetical protein
MIKLATVISVCAFATAASAQEALPHYSTGEHGVYTSPANCDSLKGDTRVCIVNQSDYAITKIDCAGHLWGKDGIQIPGGSIVRGGIAIVNFNHGACNSDFYVTWDNNATKTISGINVKDLTVLTLQGPQDPDRLRRIEERDDRRRRD